MKRLYIVIGIVIAGLFLFFILTPFIIKSSVQHFVQKQIERYTNNPYTIGDININIISSEFPDINIQLENLNINDSTIFVTNIECSANPFDIIGQKQDISIPFLSITDSRFYFEKDTTQSNSSRSFKLKNNKKGLMFKEIEIHNSNITYFNPQNAFKYEMIGLNGNLNIDQTTNDSCLIILSSSVEDFSLQLGELPLLNHTSLKWDSQIIGHLAENSFHLYKNDLHLNQLFLDLKGDIAQKAENEWDMQISLKAPDNNIKNFAELWPFLQKENLLMEGNFTLDAQIDGLMTDRLMPKINAVLQVSDAWICRSQITDTIKNIQVNLNITNPGNRADSTNINLKEITFTLDNKPFNIQFLVQNPNNPYLNGQTKGSVDFDKLLPILSDHPKNIHGIVSSDIVFKGFYTDISHEEYEKFNAKGKLTLQQFSYKNENLPNGIEIPSGSIDVSPNRLTLNKLNAKIENSNIILQGYISNYFPYLFKNQNIKGDIQISGEILDLNPFFTKKIRTRKEDISSEDDIDKVLYIPEKLDINIQSNIQTLLYERLTAQKVSGNVTLQNGIASLRNLSMDAFGGKLTLSGNYKARERHYPHFDFKLNASQLDIQQAHADLSFLRKNLPITQYAEGKISAQMQLEGDLNQQMALIFNQTSGEGIILSDGIIVNEAPALEKMANTLGNDEFKRLTIGNLEINFSIKNGYITISPFTTTLLGNRTTIEGTQNAHGEMDYHVNIDVKRKYFGDAINKAIRKIPGSGNVESLEVDIYLRGSNDNLGVSTDLSKAINKVMKEAEKNVRNKLLNGLDKLF